jgi:CheY-like chemotaxis protein/HPt (histidine-containing phosphotransfer) domain-containing protein
VADGAEAVDTLSRVEYDLILMDCQMPTMDGYAATRAIRQAEGTDRRTPIVALTAAAARADAEEAIAAGMDDVLRKPLRFETLADALDRILVVAVRVGTRTPAEADGSLDAARSRDGALPARDPDGSFDPAIVADLEALEDPTHPGSTVELFAAFVAEATARAPELREEIERGGMPALARIAHNLRGASATFGARRLALMCVRLEDAAAAGDEVDAERLVCEIEAESARAIGELRRRYPGIGEAEAPSG